MTSSQRSPGLGSTSALVKRAFSAVLRDRPRAAMRSRGDAEALEQRHARTRFGASVARSDRAIAAGKDDARIGIIAARARRPR